MPLSNSEFKNLSEICRDVAQIVFAALVVSQLATGFDIRQWPVVLLGTLTSLVFWSFSSEFAKKGKL